MKVDTKFITAMLDEVKALLGGIEETFRDGESVEETINLIASNVKAVIAAFTIEHMTAPKKEVFKKQHSFLKDYDLMHDLSQQAYGLNPSEYTEFFKAKFYLYLKRELRVRDLPINVDQHQLITFIEDNVVMNGPMVYALTLPEYDRHAYGILKLITSEIIEHRQKNPQIEIDLTPPQIKSKSLLDIL